MNSQSIACPLCKAEKLTLWFFEDNTCWIALCSKCDVPMVVYRHHYKPTDCEISYMMERLGEVAKEIFGGNNWYPDKHMRTILNHWHAHARKGEKR